MSAAPEATPLPPSEVVRAPGKAMLFGEYAVLAGAPALVAAVDRYVTAWPPAGAAADDAGVGSNGSPFVREARAVVERELARLGRPARPGVGDIDSAPLHVGGAGGRKLGLGSSAAVVAAVVGVWPERSREAVWRLCQEAHCRAQGARGSGADLAAAIWGGVIRFQLDGPGCRVTPLELSPELAVTLVDSGVPAATGPRLAALGALEREQPARHRAVIDPLVALAVAVADEAQARGTIDPQAVRAWNRALELLGAAIDQPILTEPLRQIAACADEVGGAAKPSGAGGGDLAVCFTPREATGRLRQRLLARGFEPLAVTIGARGLHAAHTGADGAAAASAAYPAPAGRAPPSGRPAHKLDDPSPAPHPKARP